MSNSEMLIALMARRPFRRSAIPAETQKDIAIKIQLAKIEQRPLCFSIPFGAYKHHKAPMAPHLNWAEVFWLDYLTQYANAIATLVNWPFNTHHTSPVLISFTYISGVLTFINGGDAEHQALTYREEFSKLCQLFSSELVKFELVDIAQQLGGPSTALAQVEAKYGLLKQDQRYQAAVSLSQLKSASRNMQSDFITDEQVTDAALRCMAMESIPERRAFNKYGHHIQLSHIKGHLSLHIGSCRTSVTQPWIGVGVLENGLPRIVSANHFEVNAWQENDNSLLPASMQIKGNWPGLKTIYANHAA